MLGRLWFTDLLLLWLKKVQAFNVQAFMRIISGFKDYYDYIAHQNVDNKIVYQRHCAHYRQTPWPKYTRVGLHKADVIGLFTDITFATIHFCGTRHRLAFDGSAFLYGLSDIHKLILDLRGKDKRLYRYDFGGIRLPFWGTGLAAFKELNGPAPTDLNKILNAPIVLELEHNDFYTNIRLASINFPQVVPPEQAFMQIYNFIIPSEAQPGTNPDDMNRYEAKGFDRKTSFRKSK